MTERDAFLAAIAAAPDDDLPKLVFADWLDERNDPAAFEQREAVALRRVLAATEDDCPRLEYAAVCEQYAGTRKCERCDGRGDHGHRPDKYHPKGSARYCHHCAGQGEFSDGRRERAEFIRVQCELAKIPVRTFGPLEGKDQLHRDNLERRERDLWVQYGPKWFGNPNRLHRFNAGHPEYATGGIVFNVLRGFVSHVRCSLSEWCGGICTRCDGFRSRYDDAYGPEDPCLECNGTGQTPAIGPQLVRRQPITTVRVNLTPVVERFDGSALAHWTDLPADVHRHLGANEWGGRTAGEATENAHRGLSTALIAWAKGAT